MDWRRVGQGVRSPISILEAVEQNIAIYGQIRFGPAGEARQKQRHQKNWPGWQSHFRHCDG
jgi:hypothetical protein